MIRTASAEDSLQKQIMVFITQRDIDVIIIFTGIRFTQELREEALLKRRATAKRVFVHNMMMMIIIIIFYYDFFK